MSYGKRGKRRSAGFRKLCAGHIVNNAMTVTEWWSAIADNMVNGRAIA